MALRRAGRIGEDRGEPADLGDRDRRCGVGRRRTAIALPLAVLGEMRREETMDETVRRISGAARDIPVVLGRPSGRLTTSPVVSGVRLAGTDRAA